VYSERSFQGVNDQALDKRLVKEGHPWLFYHSILVLKELDENLPPLQMDFSKALFWVQVHDMPLTSLNQEIGL